MILQKLSRGVTGFLADEEIVRLQHTVNVLDACVVDALLASAIQQVIGNLKLHVLGEATEVLTDVGEKTSRDAVFKTVENCVRDAVDGAFSPHVFGVKFHIFVAYFNLMVQSYGECDGDKIHLILYHFIF